MNKFFSLVFVLGWFFLVQTSGTGTMSGEFSTVIGPFDSKLECEQFSKEVSEGSGGLVTFRVTSCWEAENKLHSI